MVLHGYYRYTNNDRIVVDNENDIMIVLVLIMKMILYWLIRLD